jgi:hypothetical protein
VTPSSLSLRALLLAALSLPAAAPAQDPKAPASTPAKVEKLADWPKPDEAATKTLTAVVGQFAKPEATLHEPAHKKLVGAGDPAAPIVMNAVNDRTPEINVKLFAVLDELLQPRHGALLAREVKKPKVELRRYLTLRMLKFHDAELLPTLTELRKDKDPLTAFYASLAALALQQKDAVAPVAEYSKTHWSEVGALVAEVLPAARSPEAGRWVLESIAKANAADQMAGLRLLRYLMAKEQASTLKTYLNSPDHTVKREAINAARVLHGEPPIENLPVFQVVQHQQEWLKKL